MAVLAEMLATDARLVLLPSIVTFALGAVAYAVRRTLQLCSNDAVSVLLTADRGKILVANKAFKRGDVILQETALMSLPVGALPISLLGHLPFSTRRLMASLHCHEKLAPSVSSDGGGKALSEVLGESGEALEAAMLISGFTEQGVLQRKEEIWRLVRIWDANKLSFAGPSGGDQGIFATISRMNHSCEPNVRLFPGAGTAELLAVAAMDILPGEELCICYPERNALPMLHFLHLPCACRRKLLRRWHFECACPRCLAEGEAPASEAEAALESEAQEKLPPLLKAATSAAEFPLAHVEQLLQRSQAAGLGDGHWLVFWLKSLAAVGGSGRDLRAASLGVARASSLWLLPGGERLSAAQEAGSSALKRPGSSARLAAYFQLA